MKKKIPHYIINLYLSKTINKKDKKKFDAWLSSDTKNIELLEEYISIWNNSINLSNNFNPNIEEALRNVNSKLNLKNDKKINEKSRFHYLKIAAIIIVILGLSFLFSDIKEIFNPQYVEIIVKKGEKVELTLADGTSVWLNSACRFKYPEKFGLFKRKIYLEGEACFEIKDENTKPFWIYAKNSITKAKSAGFNVRAITGESDVLVTVTKGNVEFSGIEFQNTEFLSLNSNEQGVLNQSGLFLLKQENDNINYLAWKTGKLVFDNMPLISVTETLSEYFGLSFKIESSDIKYCRFTKEFNNPTLENILEEMKNVFNITIDHDHSAFILNGKNC